MGRPRLSVPPESTDVVSAIKGLTGRPARLAHQTRALLVRAALFAGLLALQFAYSLTTRHVFEDRFRIGRFREPAVDPKFFV